MKPEYHNKTGEVPVGEKYESVTIEEGTINIGDVVVWEDPDAHFYDETILTSLFVGTVENIYGIDYSFEDERELELGISAGVGRISIDSNLRVLSGEEIYMFHDKADVKFVDRFLNSNYKKYMQIEWTRSGDCRVSGE